MLIKHCVLLITQTSSKDRLYNQLQKLLVLKKHLVQNAFMAFGYEASRVKLLNLPAKVMKSAVCND